jgi:hypothetical protein
MIYEAIRVKPAKIKAFSTEVRDYPLNMSLSEKERPHVVANSERLKCFSFSTAVLLVSSFVGM